MVTERNEEESTARPRSEAEERSRGELIGAEHKGMKMQRCKPRGLRYNGFDKN